MILYQLVLPREECYECNGYQGSLGIYLNRENARQNRRKYNRKVLEEHKKMEWIMTRGMIRVIRDHDFTSIQEISTVDKEVKL
jgi:hypothetical protein